MAKNNHIRVFIEKDKPKELVETADSVGEKLANQKLTTNQIRNIFGMVRQIKMSWSNDPTGSYRQAVLLKPKLAYQAQRVKERDFKRGAGFKDLENALEPALDAVIEAPEDKRQERFERLTDFFEAIVAYHKKHGGRES
jgi:CRISPR-associated protein Csm2